MLPSHSAHPPIQILFVATASTLFFSACKEKPPVQEAPATVWIDLFDGKSFEGWRGFQKQTVSSDSWKVEDGCLVSQSTPGDIVTIQKFGDFDLKFDWKVTTGANGGVFYRVDESAAKIHHSGLEYQVLDNIGQPGRPANEQAAACYGLYAPSTPITRPTGEWNEGRIIVLENSVQHFLNGTLVLHYEIGSDDWKSKLQASALRHYEKLGQKRKAHLSLQNYHGHQVYFRNIKIRRLD